MVGLLVWYGTYLPTGGESRWVEERGLANRNCFRIHEGLDNGPTAKRWAQAD